MCKQAYDKCPFCHGTGVWVIEAPENKEVKEECPVCSVIA